MKVPMGVNLDMQVTHAPSSGLSRRASRSPWREDMACLGQRHQARQGRCSFAPPPPSNSHELMEDLGLGLVNHHTAAPRT